MHTCMLVDYRAEGTSCRQRRADCARVDVGVHVRRSWCCKSSPGWAGWAIIGGIDTVPGAQLKTRQNQPEEGFDRADIGVFQRRCQLSRPSNLYHHLHYNWHTMLWPTNMALSLPYRPRPITRRMCINWSSYQNCPEDSNTSMLKT